MLTLLLRRAAAQRALLAVVLVVVTAGATLLGVCGLLLSATHDRALHAGVAAAQTSAVDVSAYAVNVKGADARAVSEHERTVLLGSLAPLAATASRRAAAAMRQLDGPPGAQRRLAYLSGVDGLEARARLVSGRWPKTGTLEAVVPAATATGLDLGAGTRVRLGAEVRPAEQTAPVSVVVVGTFAPLPHTGWERDPLGGSGVNLSYADGYGDDRAAAFGPFVVGTDDLIATGSTMGRLDVTAHPDLAAADNAQLATAARSLGGANDRLRAALGGQAELVRVVSDFPATLSNARTQLQVTRTLVLVVVLLGTALTVVALTLAGRLVSGLRTDETALLAALGADRRQLAGCAALEALALAIVAAVLAVPLSSLAHSALTHLTPLSDAELAMRPTLSGSQVLSVAAGALLLSLVLVLPALAPQSQGRSSRARVGVLARSGADVVLVALAVVGWWQLRSQPEGSSARTDTIRVLAPALWLVATAAVVLRVIPVLLHLSERLAERSRSLVLPLAALEASRRRQAAAAGLLVALAASAATFGVSFDHTWQRSQTEQAGARVGTDLAVTLASPVATGQGALVQGATGGTVSAATDREVSIGNYFGSGGEPPRLLAIDTTRAGQLLRARLPEGASWGQIGLRLTPDAPAVGPVVSSDEAFVLTGSATGEAQLVVVPQLLVQDATGARTRLLAPPVKLDGRPHRLGFSVPRVAGLQVVAATVQITPTPEATAAAYATDGGIAASGESTVEVQLLLPGPPPAKPDWSAFSVGADRQRLRGPEGKVDAEGSGTVLHMTGIVDLAALPYDAADLLVTAFPDPDKVPVALSASLAQELNAEEGTTFSITVDTTSVQVVVTSVFPTIPGAAGQMAMLADADLLSRAMIVSGVLEPVVDAWWVADPQRGDAADRLDALGLGSVVSRAEVAGQLTGGPLRVGVPAALIVLVVAAVLLGLGGIALHVTSDVRARALEVARLRGLGVSRRNVVVGLVAQHGAVLALVLVAGVAVGAVAARLVGPLLVRTEGGGAPVPSALAQWPWPSEGLLFGVLLLGGLGVTAAVVSIQARRADVAHLRVGS